MNVREVAILNACTQEENLVVMPASMIAKVSSLAREYRTTFGGMVNLAMQFYFGDGMNHLSCEHCSALASCGCLLDLEEGTQFQFEM